MTDHVVVRFYAAAREVIGKSELEIAPSRLDAIITVLSAGVAQRVRVFSQCSFLIDGEICHDITREIRAGQIIDVLPPFAGG